MAEQMEQPRADSMSEDRPRSGYLGIALFLIASLLPAGSETSDSWPQWGGPDRDFRDADKEVLAALEGRSLDATDSGGDCGLPAQQKRGGRSRPGR